MEREEIFDKIEEIEDLTNDRNIGSNEAQLDFKETMAYYFSKELKSDFLHNVSQRRKLLVDFLIKYQKSCDIMHVNRIDVENFVDLYENK